MRTDFQGESGVTRAQYIPPTVSVVRGKVAIPFTGIRYRCEVHYDLGGSYLNRLDCCYQSLEKQYHQQLQRLRLANRLALILYPLGIMILGIGVSSTFFSPYFLEFIAICGAIALICGVTAHRLHLKYSDELMIIVDKFGNLYDIYLEMFRIHEAVDAHKRGETIDELLRNKPLLNELPCS